MPFQRCYSRCENKFKRNCFFNFGGGKIYVYGRKVKFLINILISEVQRKDISVKRSALLCLSAVFKATEACFDFSVCERTSMALTQHPSECGSVSVAPQGSFISVTVFGQRLFMYLR